MQKLNLPEYDFKFKLESGKKMIFDPFRNKYLQLTPEEFVRQNFARYLIEEKDYPKSLMMTEHALKLNNLIKRCDIIVFNRTGNPAALIECKAPGIKIAQEVFDQVSRYNVVFKVKYLMVTNGIKNYCCKIDFEQEKIKFLDAIPAYNNLL